MNDFQIIIRRRLIQLREEAGLTQEQLAKKIGVKRPTVTGWEAGAFLPSARGLYQLSEFYGVPIDFFFGRENTNTIDIENVPWKLSKTMGEIVRIFIEAMKEEHGD